MGRRHGRPNARKHGVTFQEAATVFADPLALIIEDEGHPEHAMRKANSRAQRGPSKRSLREMPEVDFRTVRVRRNPYEERIAAGGLVVQVGRGRPKRLLESGGTTPRSVRFSDEIWALLEKRARAKGLTLHAALRQAILEWARNAA